MSSAFVRYQWKLAAIACAFLLCGIPGCGGPSRNIIGKWRATDATAIVWEFSPNGAVAIGRDKGRYIFGDNNRVKIETPFAKSVYQIEITDDRMTLKNQNGMTLQFEKIK